MKKGLVVALAALAASAAVAPASAAEFSYGGSMRFNYIGGDPGTVANLDGFTDAEGSITIWEYRIRQFFNLKVNDHVSTNVKFEWNPQFGDEQQIAGGSGDLQLGGGSTTALSNNEVQFRIKNAFVRFDLPGAPVALTVGQQDFSTPKAIISSEDGTGIKLTVNALGEHTLFWQRLTRGGNNQTGAEDGDWFGIAPGLKVGGFTVSPHLSWVRTGGNAAGGGVPDADVWYYGLDTSGTFGAVGFTADLIVQDGDVETAPRTEVSSYVADVSVTLNAGPGALTVKGLYSPGGDDTWQDLIATDLGWSPFFHDGSDNSNYIIGIFPGLSTGGVMAVGAEFALSPTKRVTVTPNAYYLMAEDDVNLSGGAPDDFYGIEAGIQANFKAWDAVNLLAQFDYLFAGDVFDPGPGDAKDAWRVILGPRISW